jgi:tetratricopeptide (TPR) repeat protein
MLAVILLATLLLPASPADRSMAAGDRFTLLGDYELALVSYDSARQAEPWRIATYLRSGLARLQAGDPAAALVECELALDLWPASPSAWRCAGQARAALGDRLAAASALDRAVEGSADAELALTSALLRLEAGDLGGGAVALALASDIAAARGERAVELAARWRLAIIGAAADPTACRAHLARAAHLGATAGSPEVGGATAGSPEVGGATAGSPEVGGNTDWRLAAAAAVCEELMSISAGGLREAALGRLALVLDDPALAEALLRRAVGAVPASADARAYLALALLARGDAVGARDAADAALGLEGAHPLVLYARAASWRAMGEPGRAVAELEALSSTLPDEPAVLFELAAAHADLGNYPRAASLVAKATATEATADTHLAGARFHLDRALQPEAALAYAERAVAELGGEAAAWEAYGWALHLVGRGAEALPALARAVAIEPRRASARYRLAVVCEAEGQNERAREEYRRVAELDPVGEHGRRARGSLVALASRPP